jgi:hypothetical protein
MTKTSGLGDNFYIGEYDLSGDVGSLSNIHGGNTPLTVTGINKSAPERIGGKRDGGLSFSTFFNTDSGASHPALSALPTSDRVVSYFRGAAIGNDAASLVAKQIGYDGSRAEDGGFTFSVEVQSNGYGLEWGTQLTPGMRTDTAETDGTSFDTGASASHGAQLYLHVSAFSGTDCTVKLQDSDDDSTFTDVSDGAFTEITDVTSERIALGVTATVRQYVRISTESSAGFDSITFAVSMNKNVSAVTF